MWYGAGMEWFLFLGENPPQWAHPWPFWLTIVILGVAAAVIDLFPIWGREDRRPPPNEPE